jgi:hypothetical protein
MSVDIHQDSYMDLRDALVCHSGLTAYGAQEHIKRRVMAFGLATGHTHEQAACSPPPSSSPISTPPRVSPSTSPLSKNSQKTLQLWFHFDRRNRRRATVQLLCTRSSASFSATSQNEPPKTSRRRNRRHPLHLVHQDSPEPTTAQDLGARPRNNIPSNHYQYHQSPFAPLSTSYSSTIDTLSAADFRWPQELLPNSVFSQDFLPEAVDAHQALDSTNIWTPTTSAQLPLLRHSWTEQEQIASKWKTKHKKTMKYFSLASIWSRRRRTGTNLSHHYPHQSSSFHHYFI